MSGTVFLESNAYSVHEQDGFVTIKVTRTGDTSAAVNVSFASHDMSATNGADYTRVEGVATIAAGETSASIDIPIINDGLSEATETFSISIESISSGTLLFPRTATVKILDDENPATEPNEPPLVSDYDVNVDTVIVFPTIDPTYAYQPMSIVWLPGQDDLALVAHKKGQISIVNTATGEVAEDLLIDLRDEVNSNSDRGLMDIVIHPDFENHPYLYAFYVVDPPGSAGTGGNAGEDGDGNRYAHVVRWELDLSGDTPTLVPGSKEIIVGAGGQSLADVSGNGLIDSTLAENIDLPSSEIDPDTGEYKQDFIKVDSITHAGGALAFGPDGMLYVSVGDGASFNLMDPRAQSVQDVDSLSGKILRIDPITGKGLADNPFAVPGDLDANASKVWMLGLRNPFTMTFADDGRLFMSETGWYTYEEINVGGAGANFGWPFFEGADLGHLYPTPDYADLPSAADFYDQVNAGDIVITPAYRSFSHFEEDPGFHVNAIVGASSIYTGYRYPSEFLNDYFFTDIVEGEIYAVDINDRTQVKFVADIGDFGPSHFVQGPDGYMYLLDLVFGRMMRLEIANETPDITSSATVSLAENLSAVKVVTAVDPDSDTIVYSIVGGEDAGKFTIDAGTGQLSFKQAPNFEAPSDVGGNNTYKVIVQASDRNTSDSQTITVTVTNANDNNPVITSNGGGATASVNVAENSTAVTTVTATDADGLNALTYSISGGADAAKFAINETTGALSFVTAPNFEAPTDANADNVYQVIVRVFDGGLADTQTVNVTVTNVNENSNAPVITSNGGGATAAINVAENTTAVTTVAAIDVDGPSPLTYSISGGADAAKFTINGATGALAFVAAPNFEFPTDVGGNNVYDVVVRASDGTFADTQAIAVTVTNVNDIAPVINSNGGGATAAINVAENATAVTTVTATDADGLAALTYSISGGADAAKFTINSATGALAFVSAPNFEAPADVGGNNVYDVVVRASDGTFADTQAIAVTVTNVNDIDPVITSNGGGATAAINVAENTTAVTTVAATDADGLAALTYSISGGADAAKFTINGATGALAFLVTPDYETRGDANSDNVYDVVVRVSDGSRTDTQALSVTVTNVVELGPTISSNGGGATGAVSVSENTTAVTSVLVNRGDADGPVEFVIVGGSDAARFDLGSDGTLVFKTAPDREAPGDADGNNVYEVQVRATQGGLSDTQTLFVTVTDSNESTPVITSNGGGASAAIAVAENTTAITTVTATDADDTTSLIYSLAGGADQSRFEIDATTGVLRFKTAPNFDSPTDAGGNNVYDVIVQVSDGTRTDSQSLAVSVTNANDSAPVITSNGGGATASVNVAENTTAVTTVAATDADGLGTVTYAIVGGPDRGRFTIDAASGVLAFVAAPDFESPTDSGKNNVYDVEVRASDGTLDDVQSIAVTVANRNEAPVITSNGAASPASITIKENLTEVAEIAGFDPDAGTKLAFSIRGGADAGQFEIDSATGALAFVNAANFERPTDANFDNRYEVTVAVGDGALAAEQSLLVTVEDVGGKTIKGSKYRDTLKAKQSGESLVRGGGDHDVLLGTEEDDHLEGGKGNDKLYGGNGWDILDGGVGKDLLVGGPHGDSFRFSSKLGKGNVDKVKFFSPYYDRIELDADVFEGLAPGLLDRAALHYGNQAADADDRIIYHQPTGNLFFDADGSGEARKIKFAVLVNKPDKLHEGDFLVT